MMENAEAFAALMGPGCVTLTNKPAPDVTVKVVVADAGLVLPAASTCVALMVWLPTSRVEAHCPAERGVLMLNPPYGERIDMSRADKAAIFEAFAQCFVDRPQYRRIACEIDRDRVPPR